MNIKRIIDGQEHTIELEPRELTNAYYEMQYNFDVEDVKGRLEEMRDEDEDFNSAILNDEETIGEMAEKKRRLIDKYDYDWIEATNEAIEEYLY